MGNGASDASRQFPTSESTSENITAVRQKPVKENRRCGVVHVSVALSPTAASRRQPRNDQADSHVITARGGIIHGTHSEPMAIQRALATAGCPYLEPCEIPIADGRAHKILVTYCNGWYAIPAPEIFSRHSGTCLILGDRSSALPPHAMKLGDCFRLGSVGLVVTEMKLPGQEIRRLDGSIVQFLKDEALAFETEELAALAIEEGAGAGAVKAGAAESGALDTPILDDFREGNLSDSGSGRQNASSRRPSSRCSRACRTSIASDGETTALDYNSLQSHQDQDQDQDLSQDAGGSETETRGRVHGLDSSSQGSLSLSASPLRSSFAGMGMTMGERFICYMCYETHDTPEDPLVAPCDCRGDTRYLHVQCLHRWYQTSLNSHRAQVIRLTGSGSPACKICGGAYKTTFKRSDGSKASILELDTDGPYLTIVVVTRHDTNPGLFNTKFRLNFGPQTQRPGAVVGDGGETPAPVIVGRSSSCGMVLDYRTVSTVHAKVTYQGGSFYMTDNHSSNGTMVYLQDPLPLSYSQPVRLRMGRSTLTLAAQRNLLGELRERARRVGAVFGGLLGFGPRGNRPRGGDWLGMRRLRGSGSSSEAEVRTNETHSAASADLVIPSPNSVSGVGDWTATELAQLFATYANKHSDAGGNTMREGGGSKKGGSGSGNGRGRGRARGGEQDLDSNRSPASTTPRREEGDASAIWAVADDSATSAIRQAIDATTFSVTEELNPGPNPCPTAALECGLAVSPILSSRVSSRNAVFHAGQGDVEETVRLQLHPDPNHGIQVIGFPEALYPEPELSVVLPAAGPFSTPGPPRTQ